ncbi:MAG TPA: DeoR/GlpR family DNA-binding transcription regulator [Solirubrobacteraceae bacterium]|nr:DeoR/GlpR family DNA-binding transcription regulator [Solirubrobacteraceae bacterium]
MLASMSASARRGTIRGLLADRGELGIAALAAEFEVSEMTIRRDLEELEGQGVARRVRGGAISTVSRSYEPPLAIRAVDAGSAKRRIAEAAAGLIDDGQTAILDVGSTVLALAECLRGRSGLTIVTHSVHAAVALAGDANSRVILTGGIVRPGELSLVGHFAESTFRELNCDVVFLGVGGIDAAKGLTEYNLDDTRVKRAAISAAPRRIALADASKLGRVCLAAIAPFSQIDVIVTDARADHPVLTVARDAGVQVISVPVPVSESS